MLITSYHTSYVVAKITTFFHGYPYE